LKLLRDVLLVILALLVDSTFGPKLSVLGTRPDFTLIVLVYLGVFRGQTEATLLGFFAGFIQDVYWVSHFGVSALTRSVVSFAVGYCYGKVVTENFLAQASIMFAAAFLNNLLHALLSSGGDMSGSFLLFFRYGLPGALYTMALWVALLWIVFNLRKRRE